ncbi:DUF5134 domain-containing protein [Streptomyces narbonensis]|uniref:DUF5134 domain-containing protein n=1 Tax=Streptomyces narbonensis TaxID=67333 RepID=UPI001675D4AA|nr:DUF5134 domain-containing protein [Streptomyces narbonensis]GGW03551.1 DUF5134 domain-containing protein [Streptomyces narbonensis]
MHGASLSGWLLVALCAATGVYCLLRMRACAGEERRAAGGEALMGLGMAAMALPATVVAQPGWSWAVYAAVFGGAALSGLAVAARRGGHHLHHLVGSLAMLYMAVAMAGPVAQGAHSGHAMGTAGGIPVLTGGLLLYYTVYVLRAGARLAPAPTAGGLAPAPTAGVVPVAAGAPGPAWAHRPELTLVCRLSMALAMVAMLVTL